MKILFILNNFIIEPLGPMMLSTELKRHCHFVNVLKYDGRNHEEVKSRVEALKPDILAYSCTTGCHSEFIKLNRYVKRPGIISIMGGPHCTFFPEVLLENGIDVIFRGECEDTLPLFCDRYEKEKEIPYDIQGTWVKRQGFALSKNELQRLPENLDAFEPDRELIYRYPQNLSNKVRNFLGIRGCPYSCSFCYNSTYHSLYDSSKRMRYKTPEVYIDEIKRTVKRWPTGLVYFQEDNILSNREWFVKFMTMYRDEVKLPSHVHFNVNSVRRDDIKLLKEARCISCTFSPEMGCEEIRFRLLDKRTSNKKIISVAENLKKFGIKFRTENILGLPIENSLRADFNTYEFNKKIVPDVPWASLYIPFPGTKLGNFCINNGYFNVKDMDELPKSFFESSPLKNLPHKKLQQRLQSIFPLCVRLRVPKFIVSILIRLPFDKFYAYIYKKYKEYLYDEILYKTQGVVT